MAETQEFEVAPDMIYHAIFAQAGSLAKAVVEAVQNSHDSKSSKISIEIDRKTIRITDDGRGFQSRQEIDSWFKVFGFSHEGLDRQFGRFGLGRGQLWSFCSTVWRTGTFSMDVNVKARGLKYLLDENLPYIQGVEILGAFYEPMRTLEVQAFVREFSEIVKYAPLPVYVNGKLVNPDVASQMWDHETEDAYIRLTEGSALAVYNMGIFVREYGAYTVGCGGVVVTKPGKALKLNMARTDVLQSECPVWKSLRKLLQSKSDQRVKTKRTSLSEGELENLARRFVAGDLSYSEVKSVRLITDIVGRKHELESLGRLRRWSGAAEPALTVAERGSRLGERAHRLKLAFVISQATLDRFGVQSLEELLQSVRLALKADEDRDAISLAEQLASVKTTVSVRDAVPALSEGYEILKEDSLKPLELAARSAIVVMASRISMALVQQQLLSRKTARRDIYVGVSDEAEAWTDATTRIVIEREQLALLNEGVGGFIGMANILVHEFLHDQADLGSHTHDQEFYDRYHTATCGRAGTLENAVQFGMQKFAVELARRAIKIPARSGRNLDVMEQLDEVREPPSPALSDEAPPPAARIP